MTLTILHSSFCILHSSFRIHHSAFIIHHSAFEVPMQSPPKSGENFWLWFLKIASGVPILFILAIHLRVNHFLAPAGLLSHREVVAYFQNPRVVFMEGLFLFLLVVHSLLGLRGILLDLNPSERARRILDVVFLLAGILVILYGRHLLIAVRSPAG